MNRTSGNSTGQLILDFHIARAWSKNFFFYSVDSNGNRTPIDVTSYSWEMFIKRYAGDRIKQVSLTVGSGLTMVSYYDNEITADFTSTQTDLEEGEYYYELYNTTLERSYLSQKCYFTYQGPSTPATEADANILITDDTIEVELISTSGGAGTVFTDGTTITGDGSQSNPLVAVGASGALQAANNLSDVASTTTSRINLGSESKIFTVVDKSSGFSPSSSDLSGVKKIFRLTDSFTSTFNKDSTDSIPIGETVYFMTMSGFTTTIAAGAGATVETSSGGSTVICPSSVGFFLWSATKRAANTWSVQNGGYIKPISRDLTFFASALTFTNAPAAVQEISNSAHRYRMKVDLTGYSQIRFTAGVSAGAGTAGLYVQYSTDNSTFSDIGTATGTNVCSIASTGTIVSDWITLPAGAIGDVYLRGVTVGGNGTGSAGVGLFRAEVK